MSDEPNIIIDNGWLTEHVFKQLGTPGMIILIVIIFLISILIICVISLVVVYTCVSRKHKRDSRPKFGTLKKPIKYKPRPDSTSEASTLPAGQNNGEEVEMRGDNTRTVISGQTVGQRASTLGENSSNGEQPIITEKIDNEQPIIRESMTGEQPIITERMDNEQTIIRESMTVEQPIMDAEQSNNEGANSSAHIEITITTDQQQSTEQEVITTRGEIAEDGSMLI